MKTNVIIIVVHLFLFGSSILNLVQAQSNYDEHYKKASSFHNVNVDSLNYFADKALYAAVENNSLQQQFEIHSLILKSFVNRGRFLKAYDELSILELLLNTSKNAKLRSRYLMLKGLVFTSIGLNSEGLKFLFEAKNLNHYKIKYLQSEIDYYIASSFFSMGEYAKSIDYAKRSVINNLSISDSLRAFDSYILLANSFAHYDSITDYLKRADRMLENNENDFKKAVLGSTNALIAKSVGKFKESKVHYMKALNISNERGFIYYSANLYNNYAYLLLAEQNYDSAKIVLDKALNIARELENIDLEGSILDSYSDYYATIGDSIQSFNFYKQSVKLKNEYKRIQKVQQSMFLSTVFETEQKEKRILEQESHISNITAILITVASILLIIFIGMMYFRQKSVARKRKLEVNEKTKELDVANALIEGQDNERKRLAHDLHDGINPQLGAFKLTLDNKLRGDVEKSDLTAQLDDIVKSIREISHKMYPTRLEKQGLRAAIEQLILTVRHATEIDISLKSNLNDRLEEKLELNIYYLVLELVNNVIKHADASKLLIQLLIDDESIVLSAEDDGVGFDQENITEGLGMVGLRQRVEHMNGKLVIDSEPGRGTEIMIEIYKTKK